MPKGSRQPIVTRKTFQSKRPQVMGFIREHVAAGRTGYIVYPLIEESEAMDLKNALEEYGESEIGFSGVPSTGSCTAA